MSRLQLEDTTLSVVGKMAEGNPGAVDAIMEIILKHDEVDPQSGIGGLGAIMWLDTWEIYGTDIYILFNDKCNRDVRQMLMLMRAVQLGHFPLAKLKEMTADQMGGINITDDELKELNVKVCEDLEDFKRP